MILGARIRPNPTFTNAISIRFLKKKLMLPQRTSINTIVIFIFFKEVDLFENDSEIPVARAKIIESADEIIATNKSKTPKISKCEGNKDFIA